MTTSEELFAIQSEERNTALIVEERKIWISKDILAMFSPVFKNMFFGNFIERNLDHVELPGKRYDDVVEFLNCLLFYPTQKPVDNENIDIILPLVDEYDVDNLKTRCEPVLKRNIENCEINDDLLPLLSTLAKYHYKDLVKICVTKVAVKVSVEKIMKYRRDFGLPDSVTIAVLQAKGNRAERDAVFHDFPATLYNGNKNCVICESRSYSRYQCSKCTLILCGSCKIVAHCPIFHAVSCLNRARYPADTGIYCECSYDFDESLLSTL